MGQTDSLEVLSAVRVMSIGWVVLGHTCINHMVTEVNSNYDTIMEDLSYVVIYGSFYAADAFFWLSGFLMTHLFITDVNKAQDFPPKKLGMFYLHKYLIVTPMFMFCLLFFWSLEVHLGSGPMWFNMDSLIGDCEENWYASMIFLNNFIPGWKTSTCLGSGWYLACDMQFFVMSPLITLLYIKVKKEAAWVLLLVLCCVNVISAGVIASDYDLNPVVLASTNGKAYFDYYSSKPYNRVGPYVLGMACAYIIYSYRKHQDTSEVYDRFALFIAKLHEVWYIRVISFAVGLSLITILIFSQLSTIKYPGDYSEYNSWSNAQNYVFIAFERPVYGLGLSMMILPMLLGHFRPLIRALSIYPWSVLARFSFAVFLIHTAIVQVIMKSQKTVMMADEYSNTRYTMYLLIVCMAFALPIVLLIEMPAVNLEKLIFSGAVFHKESKDIEEPLIKKSQLMHEMELKERSS